MIALFISRKSCEKSQEHQCSQNLLRKIVSDFYDCDNSDTEIKYTERKKPYIDGIPFSVSHSNGVCCIAVDLKDKNCDISEAITVRVSSAECVSIGVDIECITNKENSKCRKIAEKKFFDTEQKLLLKSRSDDEYIENFCRIWTQKESYCKYTGVGLADALTFDTTAETEAEFYNTVIEVDGQKFAVSVCYNSE